MYLVALSVAGALSAGAQTPVVANGGVLNGASFARGQSVTPGSLISIFGSSLAATTATADSIPLSTAMANVSVTFNGTPAPLNGVFHDAVNGDQINAQLPWGTDTRSGTAQIVVTRGGVASAPVSVPVAQFAPGIFSTQFGVGQAIAINSDGSLAAPVGSIPGLATHPAKIGDPIGIAILATGLGPVTPPVGDGRNTLDVLRNTVTMPAVLIGGVPANVSFSGLAPQFVGVNQVNVQLPPGTPAGDKVTLQIQIGGVTSTDQVTIAVSQ